MEISHSSWPWHRSDATALAGYANMMMMILENPVEVDIRYIEEINYSQYSVLKPNSFTILVNKNDMWHSKLLPAELAAVFWQTAQKNWWSQRKPMEKTNADMKLPGSDSVSQLPKQLIDACMPLLKQPVILVLISFVHSTAKTSEMATTDCYRGHHLPVTLTTYIYVHT